MARYRRAPPQLGGEFFMTDGGIETTLIFLEKQDLPYFAAFHLLETAAGEAALRKYFRTYAALAARFNAGLVLETATWRANRDWAEKLDYSADSLAEANRKAVRLVEEMRREFETPKAPIVISGCIGPRGDGYIPENAMSAEEAEDYHRAQVDTFAGTAVDLVTAITMNYAEEAIGLARAARQAKVPVVISFTVETDGRLPTGQPLGEAIKQVDDATSGHPAYYMINCAHPSHFDKVVRGDEAWSARIRGLRANASKMSHAELNEAPELDAGDPAELGREYAGLMKSATHAPQRDGRLLRDGPSPRRADRGGLSPLVSFGDLTSLRAVRGASVSNQSSRRSRDLRGRTRMKSALIIATAVIASLVASSAAAQQKAPPKMSAEAAQGKYLVQAAGCNDCHTAGYAFSSGKVEEKLWLTGDTLGWRGPWGTTYASNLRLRVKDMTADQFVKLARSELRPPMPWFNLRDMTDRDVKAIYAYLRHLGPAGAPAPQYLPPGTTPSGPFVLFPAPPK